MNALVLLVKEGGATAIVILLLGVILIAVSVERLYFLYYKFSINAAGPLANVRELILKKNYTDAIQICNSGGLAPELHMVKQGLLAAEHGREAMRSAISGSILEVAKRCEKRTSLIALIAGVSTLLGLLGTISGLIKTFAALANADASQKAEMLGRGISEAMYATAAGLVLGICAMAVHSIVTSKGDEIISQVRDLSYKLVTWIEQSERSSGNG